MLSRSPGSHWVPYALLVLLLSVGIFLVGYSTVWGAGLISDTFQYAASARNFVQGNGFSFPVGDGDLEPMTKYPPMFSVALGFFELAGIQALQGARILNILLFGINIVLVYISVRKLTRSQLFSLLACLLFAASFVMVEAHAWALSEPLYISLGLTAFLLLHKYFEEGRVPWLILSALAVSLASLTRYAGLALVLSIAVALLLHRASKHILMDLFLFGIITILPVTVWTLRGYFLTQTLNDRTVGFYPLTVKNYVSAIDVIYGWLLPISFVVGEEKLLVFLTAIALIAFFLFLRKTRNDWPGELTNLSTPENKIVFLHIFYFLAYGLVIIASKTWIDPDIGLSDRILSPMLASLLILLAVFFSFVWNTFGKARPFVVLVSLGLIAYYVTGTFVTVQRFHETGIGIARRGWSRSEVIQSLRSYNSYPIYTNSNSSLYLWSDRSGYSIPEFEVLKENGSDKRVLLVIFNHVPPTGKRLNNLTSDLELLAEDQIVSIYALSPE